MLTDDEKFERFAQMAFKDAADKRDGIIKQLESYKSRKIEEAQTKCLEKSYKIVRKGVAEAKKKSGGMTAREPIECKKRLFELRESLVDELFSELGRKIEEFKRSEKYSDFLFKNISDTLGEAGDGEITIIIDKSDADFCSRMQEKFGYTVKCEDNLIGGCIAENKSSGKIYNNSIFEKISELRENFLADTNFSIY